MITNIFKNNLKLEFIDLNSNKIKIVNPNLFLNLNNLVEVWLNNNECVNNYFDGSSYSSLTTMNDNLKNCFNNCLKDDECAANMISTTTTTTTTMAATTTTTTMAATTTKMIQLEDECVPSKCEHFVNKTISKIDALNDFCRIEINKNSIDLVSLKKQFDVCLTKDDFAISLVNIEKVLDTKLNGRDEKFKKFMMEMKNEFDAALETSKCQLENTALKDEIAAIKQKLAEQQENLKKKYKKELAKEIKDK
jgi:hypothetical protein